MEKTLINPHIQNKPGATQVNPHLAIDATLMPGMLVNGRYQIRQKLHAAGEADVFLCEDVEQAQNDVPAERVLKLYRRQHAIKEEVHAVLRSLTCQAIAQLYDIDTWRGRTYEVWEFLAGGSLEGRQFSADELRESIIPQLLDALHTLHERNLLHRDLKPANIMLRGDNGLDLALIDFGVSSLRDEGSTVLVTQTGMTPEYSAPETFRGLYLADSDFYSLGVTICALYTGHSPYAGLSEEQIARLVALQRLPLPTDLPADLASLIAGLTYSDISMRNEVTPNRRWGYDEISRWLRGERIPVPGGRQVIFLKDFPFHGEVYRDLTQLTDALIQHWDEGKSALSSGELASAFRRSLPGVASLCAKAQTDAKDGGREDLAYMHLLYELIDDPTHFVWQGRCFENTTAFGTALLTDLQGSTPPIAFCASLLKNKALSEYIALNRLQETPQAAAIRALEEAWASSRRDRYLQLRLYYNLAYLLSGMNKLVLGDGLEFYNLRELSLHMQQLADTDFSELQAFANHLITPADIRPVPQFTAWLIALGQEDALQQWLHLFHPND